jgi:hypothetical protein
VQPGGVGLDHKNQTSRLARNSSEVLTSWNSRKAAAFEGKRDKRSRTLYELTEELTASFVSQFVSVFFSSSSVDALDGAFASEHLSTPELNAALCEWHKVHVCSR